MGHNTESQGEFQHKPLTPVNVNIKYDFAFVILSNIHSIESKREIIKLKKKKSSSDFSHLYIPLHQH